MVDMTEAACVKIDPRRSTIVENLNSSPSPFHQVEYTSSIIFEWDALIL